MINLSIPDQTFDQLKQIAQAQNTSPDALAERAIREFLRAEARRSMEREQDAFESMRSQLLAKWPGEYVAVYNQEVVDHDHDQLTLLRRIDERFPDQAVLIAQITPEPEVYTIRSPRIYGEQDL